MSEPEPSIQVNEADPFERLVLVVKGPDGESFPIGEMEAEPGTYEITRVDDE